MDPKLRMYIAELVGTFFLVLVGAGTVCANYLTDYPYLGVAGIALAEGFTLAVVLTVIFPLSNGCLNPAIALMLWVFKKANGTQTAALIAMQLIGSALAGLVLRVTFSDEVLKLARFGTPHLTALLADPDRTVTLAGLLSGIGIEIGFTFLVTIAIFATLFDRRAPRLGGVVVGLAQAAVVLFGFRLTGGSANPARWFGPAMWQLTLPQSLTAAPLADHPVYWVSPVVGALLGAFFYTVVIQPSDR